MGYHICPRTEGHLMNLTLVYHHRYPWTTLLETHLLIFLCIHLLSSLRLLGARSQIANLMDFGEVIKQRLPLDPPKLLDLGKISFDTFKYYYPSDSLTGLHVSQNLLYTLTCTTLFSVVQNTLCRFLGTSQK
jgi:hypothetical protein